MLSASISLIIRKIQGIFAILNLLRLSGSQKNIAFLRVFVGIPYSTEQGIILGKGEQGFLCGNREFDHQNRVSPNLASA